MLGSQCDTPVTGGLRIYFIVLVLPNVTTWGVAGTPRDRELIRGPAENVENQSDEWRAREDLNL